MKPCCNVTIIIDSIQSALEKKQKERDRPKEAVRIYLTPPKPHPAVCGKRFRLSLVSVAIPCHSKPTGTGYGFFRSFKSKRGVEFLVSQTGWWGAWSLPRGVRSSSPTVASVALRAPAAMLGPGPLRQCSLEPWSAPPTGAVAPSPSPASGFPIWSSKRERERQTDRL